MMRDLHCNFYTIKKIGVEHGFFPEDPKPRKYSSPSKEKPEEKLMTEQEKREKYRNNWLAAISANPHAIRSELLHIEHESYVWLRKNDLIWFDDNTPAQREILVDWEKRDEEYLDMAIQTIGNLKKKPGRPCLLSVNLVKNQLGIMSLHKLLATDRIPRTSAYLKQHIETREEWRKRKVHWAVQEFKKHHKLPTLYEVMIKAAIPRKWFDSVEEYTLECINQIFNK